MNTERPTFDLLVVGGGINGVGSALDAAGRGLKVMLCEMNDLGSATSSNSSKLIHGGLRYLEHYEFRLVRESLAEREVMIKKAPHIVRPLRFRLPHQPHLRPAWMIRAGLFLYDHLSTRTTLAGSHNIQFSADSPLKAGIKKGFEYSDGWVDDARLVVLNAVAAREKGADIRTRTRCIKAVREQNMWQVTLEHQITGDTEVVYARALINASGPWVSKLFDSALASPAPQNVRLVKGSHIVVPRLHDEAEAYILQNEDDRIVFVIPFEDDFSLIGTTDVDYQGDPSQVAISEEETDYLIEIANSYFKQQINSRDIVTTYSGVRPLLDDESDSAQAVTRDYTLELDDGNGRAPLLSIFGGKITTYRKLAEAAIDRISQYFPQATGTWTETAPLPGGEFTDKESLKVSLGRVYPWLPEALTTRLVRSYGTLSHQILDGAKSLEDLGQHYGAGLYQREVDYLITREWTHTLEDLIWRRTKLGLRLSAEQCHDLENYLTGNRTPQQRANDSHH
ncbi:glycerol-3-phosphate dehydrogenase [Aestuariirhabdus sp. Z084]|uniref:glycerol-3-phosphate dehydrogenase n=1 Tax=Aestuariirhabdus haliotis TaxID=2918751 RepID=UPI00201B4617|nr:glycerol-3-phosphate dehydrogenase [Aestuariirhabdus haliotis]MCL6417442.1 glycerol-3-phosphate dehydrogenase [Aestuariirhabdus haliotis]MCL6421386.1 glycerol-3-phosphate dehydrogenase [Aestuariirhabdus haliotis]